MRIWIKIKDPLIVYWNALRILKEINKHSGKSLRVWAKKWRLKFFEKMFKSTNYNLNGKLTFFLIFYLIFLNLCQFIQLWKITPFSTIFRFSGGGLPASPRRRAPLGVEKLIICSWAAPGFRNEFLLFDWTFFIVMYLANYLKNSNAASSPKKKIH